MTKWIVVGMMVMGALYGETTAEQEMEFIAECAKVTHAPLSVVVRDLMRGIAEEWFGETFIAKIVELEKGKFDGVYVEKWANGQEKFRASFKKGKVDGHVHAWYDDGRDAFKAFFYEEKKVGVHLSFAPYKPSTDSGFKRIRYYSEDGKLDGEQKATYMTRLGTLKTFVKYRNGMLNGKTSLYLDDKLPVMSWEDREYKDGVLVSKKRTER